MKYDGSDGFDLVTPDDVLSENQLERFPDGPEKNRIGAPGHEEWVYEDGTRIYGAEAYGFLADLVDGDVLEGERALTDIDMERLRYVAAQVKGAKRPVTWVDEGSFERAGIDEDLPVEGRFYFSDTVPMSIEVRGSSDLANRLSFLRSPSEATAEDVVDDVEEVSPEDSGMIDRIERHFAANDFVVPVVYSNQGYPVRRRDVALVYRGEDQSGLNEDFERFVKSLSDRKSSVLEAEIDSYDEGRDAPEEVISLDPGMLERPPELRLMEEDQLYQLTFYARDYEDPGDLQVELGDERIRVLDEAGEEVTSRDVEFDENLDEEDLTDLEVEDVDLNNGVGTAVLSEE